MIERARPITKKEMAMAEQKNPGRVISIFRFRMKNLSPAERDEYNTTAARMLKIVNAMPGFISFREYKNPDGELLGITQWASAEALAEWRENPEHRKACFKLEQVQVDELRARASSGLERKSLH